MTKMWKTLIFNKYGKAYCPWCGKKFKSRVCVKSHLTSVKKHFNFEHSAPGYEYKISELPPAGSNRIISRTRYRIELSGPCSCGCGEILKFPWTGGEMPDSPPPYYKSGHRIRMTHGNQTSFQKGIIPWNTGMKFPNMPRNSGMFEKGNVPKNYKGGITYCNGAVMRLVEGYYPSGVRRRVNVAREVGAQLIGRTLKKNEVAFHRDGNWRNNAAENIIVITRAESINRTRPKLYTTRRKSPEVVSEILQPCYRPMVPRQKHHIIVKKDPEKFEPSKQHIERVGQFCQKCHRLITMVQDHVCRELS